MSQALEEYLDSVLIYAKCNKRDSQKIRAELKDHLLKKIEELESQGAKHEDAVFQAIQGHGHPRTVGYALQNFRSTRRRIGAVTGFILMLTLLLLLIWLTHGSSTYASLPSLISGRVFLAYPPDPQGSAGPAHSIRLWYMGVTAFIIIALPFTVAARYLSHRKTSSAYWSFAIPTSILYLYLLIILTIPFSWLIRYIDVMGFTPKRIHALFYGLGGYIIILAFLYWVLRKPKAYTNPSS